MGSVRDVASASSASSSSSSPTLQGRGHISSSTDQRASKRTHHQSSPSVASLRTRFEKLQYPPRSGDGRTPGTDKRPTAGLRSRRAGGTGEAGYGSWNMAAESVEDRRKSTRTTVPYSATVSGSSVAARRSTLGVESTQAPVSRQRPVIAVSRRNHEPQLNKSQRDDQAGNSNFTVCVRKRAQKVA